MSTGYVSNYPTSGYASETQLRNEFQKLQEALEDTISRTGQGLTKGQSNSMESDLDLNSNDLFGVRALDSGEIRTQTLTIGGVGIQTLVDEATAQADRAGQEADRAEKAADDLSGPYEFVGDYAPAITLTKYKQLVRDSNGEFWRVSGQVDLPYTTTGTGLPEGDAFVPAGDAVLRQDLANPSKGAGLIAYGVATVESALGEMEQFNTDLANPDKGATMVAYQGGSVADKLDEIVSGAVTEPLVDAKVSSHNQNVNAHPALRASIVSEVSSHVTDDANRAEAARDAAFVNADVYPDIATGRAAVADGEQFQVVEGDEIVRYRRDSASTQTEVARYPASTMVRRSALEITRGIQVANQSPNLLSASLVNAWEMPSAVGSIVEPISVGGINSISVKAAPGFSSPRALWSMPASAFSSGLISASVMLVSATSGTGGGVSVIQRNSGGGQLVNTKVGADVISAITEPTIFSIAGVPLDPSAVSVDLDINLADTKNPGQREFVSQFPMLADGSVASFRQPLSQSVQLLSDFVTLSTGVSQKTYPLPLAVTAVDSRGEAPTIQPQKVDGGVAAALSIERKGSDLGSLSMVEVGETLRDGEIIRMSATYVSGSIGALGLLFGSTDSARGFVTRASGQALGINYPDGSFNHVVPPTPRTFEAGERITVDARLFGGVAGDYTVRFYIEYEDGERLGPYDVSGILSIDGIFFGCRGPSLWTDVVVTRHGQAVYPQDGSASSAEAVIHVAKTGSDSGAGTALSPFLTIGRAISALVGGGIIEVGGGEYREALTISHPGHVWLRSKVGERAIILGSEQLSVTKTTGYSKVYQAPLASKPTGMGGSRGKPLIVEWGTPSKPILESERHYLQGGKTHRLPYTEMFEAASLAELDTPAGNGKWWWESGTIYFAATGGSDATAKRYEARARVALTHNKGSIRLTRVDAFLSNGHGMGFSGVSAQLEDCRILGSRNNGLSHYAGTLLTYRGEFGGNGNDGINGTIPDWATKPETDNRITAVCFDPWCHDNGDDGLSYHHRGDATMVGGLCEYDTKAGVVHVTGAGCACFNTVARGAIYGFSAATLPTDDDSREITVFRCVGTQAFDNLYSYSSSDAVLNCEGTLAVNPSGFGYRQKDSGSLNTTDCKYIGDPEKMKSGDVNVISSMALT